MDTNYELTEGVLETIMNGGTVQDPIVQILGSQKVISNVKETERCRLLLSDGKFKVNVGIYTVPSSNQLGANALDRFSIIKLKRYVSNVIKTKENRDMRILLILELELITEGDSVGHVIGDPTVLTDSESQNPQSELSTSFAESPRSKKIERLKALSNARIICSISSLNPFHNNWVIKARVITKTNVRNWSNARGEGKLFSVTLADQSGEIKCTAFRDLVDQFFDTFEVDKVYFVSKCVCKPINRQFCNLKHEFEMVFTPSTVVEESISENEMVPQFKYNFTSIDKIAAMVAGTLVDVIAICLRVSDLQIFVAKSTSREMKKKEMFLVDQSRVGIFLTLWGLDAESFQINDNPVIAVKTAKIHEFQGTKNMSLVASSQIRINPDIPESETLKDWFDSGPDLTDVTNISARSGSGGQMSWMTFKEVQAEDIAKQKTGIYFQTFASILVIRLDRAVYKSCPSPDCNKKIIDLENGMYRCEKCNREYDNFKYRLLISMNLSDASSNQWVTVFSSEAEKILERTAQEIGEAMDKDSENVSKWFEDAQFKQLVFKCRAKMDYYNDEQKLRVVVIGVGPVNFEEHNAYLLQRIGQFRAVAKT